MRILLLLFLPLVFGKYHTTNKLLSLIKHECKVQPRLTCDMCGDMLVVDWNKEKPRDIVWTFNEHARERITAELALEMVKELKNIKTDRRITIVPVVNVWGRKHVENGYSCQRKNKNGVDTNRNYPQRVRHHYARSSEEYEGNVPLSEPETQLVSGLLEGASRYVNVHSGEYSLYMPWDSALSRPPHYDKMKKTLKLWSKHCPQCAVGPAAIKSLYKAYGSAVDYATSLGVEAYTFEIFGKRTYDCTSMFNPSEEEMDAVIQQWKAIMTLTVQ